MKNLLISSPENDAKHFMDRIQLGDDGMHNARYLHFMAHGKFPEKDPAPLFITMALYMKRNGVGFSE